MGQQRERVKLREGTTITRENGSRAYIIWCQKCDFYTTAVNGNGFLTHKQAVKLANRHSC